MAYSHDNFEIEVQVLYTLLLAEAKRQRSSYFSYHAMQDQRMCRS